MGIPEGQAAKGEGDGKVQAPGSVVARYQKATRGREALRRKAW